MLSAYLLFKAIVRGYSLTKNIDFKYLYCHVIYVVSQSVMSDICDHSMDYSPPGSSIDGLLQVTILEWVAIPFPGDLPDPEIKLGSPALKADSLPSEVSGKPKYLYIRALKNILKIWWKNY